MGVQVRLIVYAPDEQTAIGACRAAFQRIAEIDAVASDWRVDSELNRLCSKAGGPPVHLSAELFLLLYRGQELARRSNGAFDITAGPVIRLWRQARKTGTLPNMQDLQKARSLVGWEKLRLDLTHRTAQLEMPGMQLDLGGIAKGYAGDCALAVLRRHGLSSAACEIGGDIILGEAPPGKPGWIVEVTHMPPGNTSLPLVLRNCAISTSGDLEQFVVIDGQRYSHIVDPRTGMGLTSRLLVSVIAADGLTSDGLSTALSVLDRDSGLALARLYGAEAYIRTVQDTDSTP